MSQDIKNLIEKIQEEGIKTAEGKAKEIEDNARKQAGQIIKDAQLKAEKLLSEAKENLSEMEQKQKTLLSQAGRDLLILLRKEINVMLDKLITAQIKEALTAEVISKIVSSLAKDYSRQEKSEIIVSLRKEDLQLLEKGFLHKLQEEIKKGITLRPSEDIQGGFALSFDAGKSQFDFSDKALAEYIGTYLKPKLGDLLKP